MQLDLNLLTVLDALLEEGSVQGAALRLHLSSPAVSRSLGRIRVATGDAILVRTGRTMTPTPYAVAAREQVHSLVLQANALLSPRRQLDLATLDRVFTLQCHDALASAVAGDLVDRVQRRAPHVTVRLVAETPVDTGELRRGTVDLELGASVPTSPELRCARLATGRLAVAAGEHSDYGIADVDVASYALADHVIISRRGRLRDHVDDVLSARGLSRRVVATAATTLIALQIVRRTDALVTIPEHASPDLVTAFGLRIAPLPFEVPPVQVVAVWHQRHDEDPAHGWLREQVRDAITSMHG